MEKFKVIQLVTRTHEEEFTVMANSEEEAIEKVEDRAFNYPVEGDVVYAGDVITNLHVEDITAYPCFTKKQVVGCVTALIRANGINTDSDEVIELANKIDENWFNSMSNAIEVKGDRYAIIEFADTLTVSIAASRL